MDSVSPANAPPAPSPVAGARAPGAGWLFVGVLVAALLAQGATLGGGFALDDVPVVQRNPVLTRGLGALPRLFREPSWPGELEIEPYRPLAVASFVVERGVSAAEAKPLTSHVVNLLLHAAAAALLLGLLLALAPRRPLLATTAALLFAVHPLAAPGVALLTGRSALLGLCFALLSLRAWVAYRPGREALLPLAALCQFLALLSCEAFVALPLVALLLDLAVLRLGLLGALRSRWIGYLALAASWCVWFVLWAQHGPGGTSLSVPPPAPGDRLFLGLEAFGRDVLKLFVPVGFVADRGHEAVAGKGWPLEGARLVTVVLSALALLAAWWLPFKSAAVGALRTALLASGLLLLGASLTLPAGQILEDRWGTLALPSLAVLGGLAAESLYAWSAGGAGRRSLTRFLPGLLVVAATLLSVRLAKGLADDATVHAQLMKLPGGHGPALLRRAERLMRVADEEVSISAHMPARHPDIELDPGRLPHVQAARQARDEAKDLLLGAVRLPETSGSSQVWLLLGTLQLDSETPGMALESFKRARALDPLLSAEGPEDLRRDPAALHRAARIHAGLARVFVTQGQPARGADAAEAAKRFELEAMRVSGRPGDFDLLFRAALILVSDGRYAEGLPLLEEIAQGAPDRELRQQAVAQIERGQLGARERVASILAQARVEQDQNQVKSAVELYEEALRVDASSFEAAYWAAQLRGVHFGSYERALDYVDAALPLHERRPASAERDTQVAQLKELRQRLLDRRARDEAEIHADEKQPKQPR